MHMKKRTVLYVLIGLTICFIWGNSLMPASVSGKLSGQLAQLLSRFVSLPLNPEGDASDGLLRKLAHGTEFCILGAELGVLWCSAGKRCWEQLAFRGAVVALLDETIQLFVSGRAGMIRDVWIDLGGYTVGVLTGLFLCMWLMHRRGISQGSGDCPGTGTRSASRTDPPAGH